MSARRRPEVRMPEVVEAAVARQIALPRVSVALCVYNGERWLKAQLDSLVAQRDVQLEIIVVDDCSTDRSRDILRWYARRDSRIQLHENPTNLGHLRSFEKCMALCTSPLIAPCDQDDIWHPRKLAILAEAIGDSDMAYCDSAYIDEAGRPLNRRISDDLGPMHAGHDALRYAFQNTVSGHAMLVRRRVLDKAPPFPKELYHDWWLAICAASGNGVTYVDEPLVQFRRHVDAASPLGKDDSTKHKALPGKCTRNRKWLEQLDYMMQAIGSTDWPAAEHARDWHSALRSSLISDYRGLLKLSWRDRASVPPWNAGFGWLRAVRFYARLRRKVNRARREPALTTPLFGA
ncbi:Glycosyl transferase family 2 [Lysobacter dokdonensis DS-58]|uniref:Glycosyl transferase family 2 n=1 Tax=Lysobacter dokdonensis DS-58 TaxID=1300345 RepID=A0A0A2WEB8_9GAMM|nr:glycosyltransferase [Lysobacter dokdonensis]KGQ18078.1 Glycosyl transferase family 2 [Lysobacter dokdonensis DS-58]